MPKRDIYRDRCETYQYTKAEPMIFTTEGVINVNNKGEIVHKTLDIDNSRFTTGATPKGEPIALLKEL